GRGGRCVHGRVDREPAAATGRVVVGASRLRGCDRGGGVPARRRPCSDARGGGGGALAMSLPDFRSRAFLARHVRDTLAFYHPRCVDPSGGFYHFFRDDGTVYDASTRHLVSSTRFVVNFARAWRHDGESRWRDALVHGAEFLRRPHRDPTSGGYRWLLRWENGRATALDATNHCYGLAFVLLAAAHAVLAGVEEARAHLDETFALMERHFWEPAAGLYADEASADWSVLSPYRGQNANMHA